MSALGTNVVAPRDFMVPQPVRPDGATCTAGQTFTRGWMLMRAAAGTAQVATEAAGLLPGGFADRSIVTADPGNNDFVNMETGYLAVDMSTLSGDAFLDTDGPGPIYAINNNEFGKLPVNPSTGAARSIAGCFLRLDRTLTGSKCVALIGPDGVAMAKGIQASAAVTTRDVGRGVFTSLGGTTTYASGIMSGPTNTALGAQDGLTIAVGDILWAQKGLTNLPAAAQAGPWQILTLGSGSSKWTACRPWWYATGSTIPMDFTVRIGPEGTGVTPALAGTRWMAFCAPGCVVDTDDPLFWPQYVSGSYTASSGVVLNADATFPIRSTTLSSIKATNQGTAAHASTVGPPRVTAVTAGAKGTSALTMKAESAPGTTNTSDVGVYTVAVQNW